MKLSQLKRYNDYSNFMTEYGSEVNAPLEAFERQYGVKYVQPQNIVMSTDSASKVLRNYDRVSETFIVFGDG